MSREGALSYSDCDRTRESEAEGCKRRRERYVVRAAVDKIITSAVQLWSDVRSRDGAARQQKQELTIVDRRERL
jgi:hypothetical protein